MLAAGFSPTATWADAGSPKLLSAAKRADGSFVLCGIGDDLSILFQIPLPARGHAAVAHPVRPEAITFARRPGTFAVVINCVDGTAVQTLDSPTGRHFFGHGTYSLDGRYLFTTENDYDNARGVIGVWDAAADYARIGEFDSGGIGPHEIKRIPGTDTLVVANGGIETHPDAGRAKLNIPTMAPNLTYIEDGEVVEVVTLDAQHQKNSIRHLCLNADGQVAFGMQWQGSGEAPDLLGLHRLGEDARILRASAEDARAMSGYIGSVAFSADGKTVAVTSPRGGLVQSFGAETGAYLGRHDLADVGGIAPAESRFIATSGGGVLARVGSATPEAITVKGLSFDNHVVPV